MMFTKKVDDKPMTVAEFIELLKTFDPNLPVVHRCCSDWLLLDAGEIEVKNLVEARKDGWVQNYRTDMPTIPYLALPGN